MAKKTSKTKKTNDLQAETALPELISPELEAAPTIEVEAAIEAAPQAEAASAAEEPEAKKEPKAKKAKAKAKPKAKAKAKPEAEVAPEAEAAPEPEAGESAEAEDASEPADEAEDNSESADEAEAEFEAKPRPPAKLERLQKILAQAGIASRRHAEEMIEQGRVQVNGKIVTVLGTKADAGRDHIRVDGKLLQGNERLRYFVLNKPKGFVTTVKDPEGRPTVMQFFEKMKERLYPVGRLDYQSEGLLLVTNDGELANKLTKAGSGVEKTYLVKVAGQPTEDELNVLRGGVTIERGKPGSALVRTSPARIRQVRQGDNPWYEVVLIEGRNRELRKMFESIGHFVEKIRRVGYGPLVLDQEPGNLRELQPQELELLRKASEGKLRTPKSKDLRRRNAADAALLPTVMPKPSRPRPAMPFASKPFAEPAERGEGPARAKEPFRRTIGSGTPRFGSARPAPSRFAAKPSGEGRPFTPKPAWKKPERPASGRPAARFTPGSGSEGRPRVESSRPGSERTGRTGADRSFTAKPVWNKQDREERPAYNRPPSPRREAPDSDEDFGPVRPPNLQIEEISQWDHPSSSSSRPGATRPYADRPRPSRPSFGGPASSSRPGADKPFRSKSGLARPFTTSSGMPRAGGARPSSKPGGASAGRPSTGWKPGKPGGRSYGPGASARSGSIDPRTGSGYRPAPGGRGSYAPRPATGSGPSGSARPFTPRAEGASDYRPTKARPYSPSTPRAERKAGSDWKPKSGASAGRPSSTGRKPGFGGVGKSYGGSNSKPRTGGFSKSGFKGKSAGFGGKRTGSRPGGKKRG